MIWQGMKILSKFWEGENKFGLVFFVFFVFSFLGGGGVISMQFWVLS